MAEVKSESKIECPPAVLVDISEKLTCINDRLDKIEEKIKQMKKSCTSMDNHIGFVENVYSTLKSPLDYIANVVTTTRKLPPYPHSRAQRVREPKEVRLLGAPSDLIENKK
jgi:archaellum component FlaC